MDPPQPQPQKDQDQDEDDDEEDDDDEYENTQLTARAAAELPKIHTLAEAPFPVSPSSSSASPSSSRRRRRRVNWSNSFDVEQGENWLRIFVPEHETTGATAGGGRGSDSSRRCSFAGGILDDDDDDDDDDSDDDVDSLLDEETEDPLAVADDSDDHTREGDGTGASETAGQPFAAAAAAAAGGVGVGDEGGRGRKPEQRRPNARDGKRRPSGALERDDGNETRGRVENRDGGKNEVAADAVSRVPVPRPIVQMLHLDDLGQIDAPAWDCFLCVDVDGPNIAIKDMRYDEDDDEDDDEEDDGDEGGKNGKRKNRPFPFAVYLARRGQSTLLGTGHLERLPRRQMRLLREGDRICFSSIRSPRDNSVGLVLEYRYVTAIRTQEEEDDEEDGEAVLSDPNRAGVGVTSQLSCVSLVRDDGGDDRRRRQSGQIRRSEPPATRAGGESKGTSGTSHALRTQPSEDGDSTVDPDDGHVEADKKDAPGSKSKEGEAAGSSSSVGEDRGSSSTHRQENHDHGRNDDVVVRLQGFKPVPETEGGTSFRTSREEETITLPPTDGGRKGVSEKTATTGGAAAAAGVGRDDNMLLTQSDEDEDEDDDNDSSTAILLSPRKGRGSRRNELDQERTASDGGSNRERKEPLGTKIVAGDDGNERFADGTDDGFPHKTGDCATSPLAQNAPKRGDVDDETAVRDSDKKKAAAMTESAKKSSNQMEKATCVNGAVEISHGSSSDARRSRRGARNRNAAATGAALAGSVANYKKGCKGSETNSKNAEEKRSSVSCRSVSSDPLAENDKGTHKKTRVSGASITDGVGRRPLSSPVAPSDEDGHDDHNQGPSTNGSFVGSPSLRSTLEPSKRAVFHDHAERTGKDKTVASASASAAAAKVAETRPTNDRATGRRKDLAEETEGAETDGQTRRCGGRRSRGAVAVAPADIQEGGNARDPRLRKGRAGTSESATVAENVADGNRGGEERPLAAGAGRSSPRSSDGANGVVAVVDRGSASPAAKQGDGRPSSHSKMSPACGSIQLAPSDELAAEAEAAKGPDSSGEGSRRAFCGGSAEEMPGRSSNGRAGGTAASAGRCNSHAAGPTEDAVEKEGELAQKGSCGGAGGSSDEAERCEGPGESSNVLGQEMNHRASVGSKRRIVEFEVAADAKRPPANPDAGGGSDAPFQEESAAAAAPAPPPVSTSEPKSSVGKDSQSGRSPSGVDLAAATVAPFSSAKDNVTGNSDEGGSYEGHARPRRSLRRGKGENTDWGEKDDGEGRSRTKTTRQGASASASVAECEPASMLKPKSSFSKGSENGHASSGAELAEAMCIKVGDAKEDATRHDAGEGSDEQSSKCRRSSRSRIGESTDGKEPDDEGQTRTTATGHGPSASAMKRRRADPPRKAAAGTRRRSLRNRRQSSKAAPPGEEIDKPGVEPHEEDDQEEEEDRDRTTEDRRPPSNGAAGTSGSSSQKLTSKTDSAIQDPKEMAEEAAECAAAARRGNREENLQDDHPETPPDAGSVATKRSLRKRKRPEEATSTKVRNQSKSDVECRLEAHGEPVQGDHDPGLHAYRTGAKRRKSRKRTNLEANESNGQPSTTVAAVKVGSKMASADAQIASTEEAEKKREDRRDTRKRNRVESTGDVRCLEPDGERVSKKSLQQLSSTGSGAVKQSTSDEMCQTETEETVIGGALSKGRQKSDKEVAENHVFKRSRSRRKSVRAVQESAVDDMLLTKTEETAKGVPGCEGPQKIDEEIAEKQVAKRSGSIKKSVRPGRRKTRKSTETEEEDILVAQETSSQAPEKASMTSTRSENAESPINAASMKSAGTAAESLTDGAAGRSRKKRRARTPAPESTEPPVVRSSRKQTRRHSATGDPLRIVATNVDITKDLKNNVKRLGGVLLEDVADACTATHVIASDGKKSIRRTPKLMVGLCRTPNIVSLEWLKQSAEVGEPLPCDDFLILNDIEAEMQYGFAMHRTLDTLRSNLLEKRFLLDGWNVHVCRGVANNRAPPEKELRLIVEAAGGSWIPKLSKPKVGEGGEEESSALLVITSDPETKKQVSPVAVAAALRNGAQKRTTSWLFHAIMTQESDLYILPGGKPCATTARGGGAS